VYGAEKLDPMTMERVWVVERVWECGSVCIGDTTFLKSTVGPFLVVGPIPTLPHSHTRHTQSVCGASNANVFLRGGEEG